MHDFDGPHWSPGTIGPDGRLSRFHKGGDNGAALAEQKKARRQSQQQFTQQMQVMRDQMKAAEGFEIPKALPVAPPAYAGADVVNAGRDMRRASRRRFGAGRSVFAGESKAAPVLGGAVPLAA